MQAWTIFRRVRSGLLALLILLCLSCLTLLCIPMIRGWDSLTEVQHTLLVSMAAIDFVTATLVYLMMVISFNLWLDCVRGSFLLVVHGGGAAVFTLLNSHIPCGDLGTTQSCTDLKIGILFNAWAICALLLMYLTSLSVAACLRRHLNNVGEKYTVNTPVSPGLPLARPAAAKRTPSLDSRIALLDAGHAMSSLPRASVMSIRPSANLVVVNGEPAVDEPDEDTSTISMASRIPLQVVDHYGSISHIPISTPTSRQAFSDAYFQKPTTTVNELYPASATFIAVPPRSATVLPAQPSPRTLPFPNPFRDPPPRYGSPDSTHSMTTMGSFGTDFRGIGQHDMFRGPHLLHDQTSMPIYPVQVGSAESQPTHLLPIPWAPHQDSRTHLSTYDVPTSAPASAPVFSQPTLVSPSSIPRRAPTPLDFAPSVRSVSPSVHSHISAVPMRSDYLAPYTFYSKPMTDETRPLPVPPVYNGQVTRRPLSALLRFEEPRDPRFQPNNPYAQFQPAQIRRYGSVANGAAQGTQVYHDYARGNEARQVDRVHISGERRGSDGQVVDYTQWRRLVMNAAHGRA